MTDLTEEQKLEKEHNFDIKNIANFEQIIIESPIVVEKWMKKCHIRPKTQRNYLLGFHAFLKFCEMKPIDLRDEALYEQKNDVPEIDRQAQDRIIRFKDTMVKKYTKATARNYTNAVISFYKTYGFALESKYIYGNLRATISKKNSKTLSKENIQTLLEATTHPVERAIILVGVSSGLSAIDIINLKVKDFLDRYHAEYNMCVMELERKKTDIEFATCLSPECCDAINAYIQWRNRKPTTKDNKVRKAQLEKQRITSDEGYLFVLKNISDDYLTMPHETEDEWQAREDMRKWNDNSFTMLYKRLAQKSGLVNAEKGAWNPVRSHNLRKYFNTTLILNDCNPDMVSYMMGHAVHHDTYLRPSTEEVLEKYKVLSANLTIAKPKVIVESPEYIALKDKYNQSEEEKRILLAETDKHVVERSELQELRAKVEKIEEFEAIFAEQLKPYKELHENHNNDIGAQLVFDHLKMMATDPEYRRKFNESLKTEIKKPKEPLKW